MIFVGVIKLSDLESFRASIALKCGKTFHGNLATSSYELKEHSYVFFIEFLKNLKQPNDDRRILIISFVLGILPKIVN